MIPNKEHRHVIPASKEQIRSVGLSCFLLILTAPWRFGTLPIA